jgi:hypothetical protein
MNKCRWIIAGRVLSELALNSIGLWRFGAALQKGSKRKRIAFQAYSVHLAQFFRPVISALRAKAPAVDIHFVILPHPHFTGDSTKALYAFALKDLKIPEQQVHYFWETLWHKYDLIVCTDVYAKFPLRGSRTVFLNHGPGIARRLLGRSMFRKTLYDFDLVLLSGEEDRNLLQRHCTAEFVEHKVKSAGFPYLDRLSSDAGTRTSYLRALGLDSEKPVVLLAPSWRGLQDIHDHEPGYFESLVETLSNLDFNLVIKLHACSFNKMMTRGVDWSERLRPYVGGRVRLDEDVDDIPALQHADVLISDISSRAYNFMLLDKPVILIVPDGVFSDEFDRERIALMQQAAFTARSIADVQAFFTGNGRGSCNGARRSEPIARRCFANHGCATEAVVSLILQEVDRTSG